MRTKNLRSLTFAVLCLTGTFALAYTTAPCVTSFPTCNLNSEGAQCGGSKVIHFGDAQPFAYYYRGANTVGRCGGTGSGNTCSELVYRDGTAREVFCGDTSLGWCFTAMGATVNPTGYDCGGAYCPDAPTHLTPNIIGSVAPCNIVAGTRIVTPCATLP